jgi:hypothetical protein
VLDLAAARSLRLPGSALPARRMIAQMDLSARLLSVECLTCLRSYNQTSDIPGNRRRR